MEVDNETKSFEDDLDIILPPWIAFPDIHPFDMYWRMGRGEEYLENFFKFYERLPDQEAFRAKFPAENDWEGFYDD